MKAEIRPSRSRARASVIKVIRLTDDERLRIPTQATDGSAGFDLQAVLAEPVKIYAGESLRIGAGFKIWIRDAGIVGLVFPKSGVGGRGFGIKNLTGVIDSDYQGEVAVTLWNTNPEAPIEVHPFMQIAQILFVPVMAAVFVEEAGAVFTEQTERGEGGWGSTTSESSETGTGARQ